MSEDSLNERKRALLRKYNAESNRVARESIETALFLLMQEKDFASISVTEIVERAGVSRSAYYRNYESREAILSSVFEQCVGSIMDALRPELAHRSKRETFLRLFETVAGRSRLFSVMQRAGLEWKFLTDVNNRLLECIPEEKTVERWHLCSWIGSTVNILFLWVGGGMTETPERMADICAADSQLVDYLVSKRDGSADQVVLPQHLS